MLSVGVSVLFVRMLCRTVYFVVGFCVFSVLRGMLRSVGCVRSVRMLYPIAKYVRIRHTAKVVRPAIESTQRDFAKNVPHNASSATTPATASTASNKCTLLRHSHAISAYRHAQPATHQHTVYLAFPGTISQQQASAQTALPAVSHAILHHTAMHAIWVTISIQPQIPVSDVLC